MSQWSETEQRECPACEGVPHGQAWLCSLCGGRQRVSQARAVKYCAERANECEAALSSANAALTRAIFGSARGAKTGRFSAAVPNLDTVPRHGAWSGLDSENPPW